MIWWRSPGIAALGAVLIAGCAREAEQPWRKALDEGKVVRLGGEIGKLAPQPPSSPPPVAEQPPPVGTASSVSEQKRIAESLPIPPPPIAIQKKADQPADDDPVLLPPK
jgi:hypothetical protein